ncbi:VCBS repeat-containing protein [Streptomyces sp. B-S-A8]|uniref:VCBS repeat-containing protein n=1 Tax=Streptomyces solicavernae TaxID=3043614 RepID=A0ABT6RTD2_9ACTN|nr:VCBS repeat-containing protein [Streptomyces sp. B-S-A8]MDI3387600.1 VCBS repeat-containing protein [Streptomyces sp. B-S-A8]
MTSPTPVRAVSRAALSGAALCAVSLLLVPLAGCGGAAGGDSATGGATPAAKEPAVPGESRPPEAGEGTKDPDDVNGDGHRDLLVPVSAGTGDQAAADQRVAVVYGSAKGLDPATRTVYGRRDLGLPASPGEHGRDSLAAGDVLTADLDGDGFPDFVSSVGGTTKTDGRVHASRAFPRVTWGGPEGPQAQGEATAIPLPQDVAALGMTSLVRGDFDGDGHHDLAGIAQNGLAGVPHNESTRPVVLYGPFTRAGAPARTDAGLPYADGTLVADAIDPSGEPRATSLLVQGPSDGEQSQNTLYRAREGSPLTARGEELRAGSAHAFGDFDGDGVRDVAIGDDGGRNNEPGYESEAPDVDGSLAVYPGKGGAPVTHRLPEPPKGRSTDYGPGGFVTADPDGDGRDAILVATYEGATLIEGDRRTPVLREGPEVSGGEKTSAKWRHARPAAAADFDGDGKDELVLHWAADTSFGLYGEHPTHWWITEGTTARDQSAFSTVGLAKGTEGAR